MEISEAVATHTHTERRGGRGAESWRQRSFRQNSDNISTDGPAGRLAAQPRLQSDFTESILKSTVCRMRENWSFETPSVLEDRFAHCRSDMSRKKLRALLWRLSSCHLRWGYTAPRGKNWYSENQGQQRRKRGGLCFHRN